MNFDFVSGVRADTAGIAAAASHKIATRAIQDTLSTGGNAVDAAVAGALVLGVVAPEQAGFGGTVTLLHADSTGEVTQLDGRGNVPAGLTADALDSVGIDEVPWNGHIAATIPGALGGLIMALRRWGALPVQAVFTPALAAAKASVPMTPEFAALWGEAGEWFTSAWPTTGEAFSVSVDGSTLRFGRPALASFLSDLVQHGLTAGAGDREAVCDAMLEALYRGSSADAIVDFSQHQPWLDATGKHNMGYVTHEDLADFAPSIDRAVRVVCGDHVVHLPAGSACALPVGLSLALMWRAKETSKLNPVERAHQLIEAIKLGQADRASWGAQLTAAKDYEECWSAGHLDVRAEAVSDEADYTMRPQSPTDRKVVLPHPSRRTLGDTVTERAAAVLTGGFASAPTVATAIAADDSGSVVSVQICGGAIHEAPVIPSLGFNLSNLAASPVPSYAAQAMITRATWGAVAVAAPHLKEADAVLAGIAWDIVEEGLHSDSVRRACQLPRVGVQHGPEPYPPAQAHLGRVRIAAGSPDLSRNLRERGHDVVEVGRDVGGTLVGGIISGDWFAAVSGSAPGSAAVGD